MNSELILTPPESLFLKIKSINNPLNKRYKILPYSQQIIGNENNIFDLIRFQGNKKKFNQFKSIYTEERNKIKKEILIHQKKEKIFKNSNVINIQTFDADKINIHSPMSIMEGNFISGLIQYCKNKKIKNKKILEYKKKNKFVFKRASVTQDFHLKNFSPKKIDSKNKDFSSNNSYFSSENSNNENNIKINTKRDIKENSKISHNDKKLKIMSIYDFFMDDDFTPSLESKNEFRKTINSIFYRSYNKLSKDKKSLSADNFFGIQSKKIKVDGNKDQKLKLRHKKLSKLFFSKLFKEENKIVGNLNDINNNLLNIKNSNHIEDLKTITNNFRTPRKNLKNNYRELKENLTSLHKKLYKFPEVNKYIYGSRNPLSIFSKLKIKSKINTHLSEQ